MRALVYFRDLLRVALVCCGTAYGGAGGSVLLEHELGGRTEERGGGSWIMAKRGQKMRALVCCAAVPQTRWCRLRCIVYCWSTNLEGGLRSEGV
jgi:hypothetical protein